MYNESSKQATIKYQKEKIKKVPFEMGNAEYDALVEHCERLGIKVSTYIKEAAEMKMKRVDV